MNMGPVATGLHSPSSHAISSRSTIREPEVGVYMVSAIYRFLKRICLNRFTKPLSTVRKFNQTIGT